MLDPISAYLLLLLAGTLLLGFGLQRYSEVQRFRIGVVLVFRAMLAFLISYRLFFTINTESAVAVLAWCGYSFYELMYFATEIFYGLDRARLSDRKEQVRALTRRAATTGYCPSVDVFLPTYNEDLALLERSILACQNIRYSNFKVHVLDDTRRVHLKGLCERLGANYVTRADNVGAKAGNVNNALAVTSGDLVAVFDADYMPSRDFLGRVVPFFLDPEHALVQVPQVFFNTEAVTRNLGFSRYHFPCHSTQFHQIMQRNRDAAGATMCTGSGWITRRTDLESCGGLPTDSLCEDWGYSMRLNMRKRKNVFLCEPLQAGEGAETIAEFVSQRLRWMRGSLQMLHSTANPLRADVTFRQRIHDGMVIVNYLLIPAQIIQSLTVPICVCFGVMPFSLSQNGLLFVILPFIIVAPMIDHLLGAGFGNAIWSPSPDMILLVPRLRTLCSHLLGRGNPKFRVTSKNQRVARTTLNWALAWPLLLLLALYVIPIATFGRQILAKILTHRDDRLLFLVWVIYSFVPLWTAFMMCFDAPLRPTAPVVRPKDLELPTTVLELDDSSPAIDLRLTSISYERLESVVYLPPSTADALQSAVAVTCRVGTAPVTLTRCTLRRQSPWVFSWRPGGRHAYVLTAEITAKSAADARQLVDQIYCSTGQWFEARPTYAAAFPIQTFAPLMMGPLVSYCFGLIADVFDRYAGLFSIKAKPMAVPDGSVQGT